METSLAALDSKPQPKLFSRPNSSPTRSKLSISSVRIHDLLPIQSSDALPVLLRPRSQPPLYSLKPSPLGSSDPNEREREERAIPYLPEPLELRPLPPPPSSDQNRKQERELDCCEGNFLSIARFFGPIQ
ncbi:hypothetical protein KFK09_025580 [Dendrobium nobile]|uniref:Uncharacterized protein n=1 Tax=Dendrobium nobile TaxID=94219 RepID=A0A8T3A500_DENNO|nr:hypothetical protein KFK09_025580 [Dendrobium nobile]